MNVTDTTCFKETVDQNVKQQMTCYPHMLFLYGSGSSDFAHVITSKDLLLQQHGCCVIGFAHMRACIEIGVPMYRQIWLFHFLATNYDMLIRHIS